MVLSVDTQGFKQAMVRDQLALSTTTRTPDSSTCRGRCGNARDRRTLSAPSPWRVGSA